MKKKKLELVESWSRPGLPERKDEDFEPEKQYGSSILPTEGGDFDELRQMTDLVISESLPEYARGFVEYATAEKDGFKEMAWLYPGLPRAKGPKKSAADLLTLMGE